MSKLKYKHQLLLLVGLFTILIVAVELFSYMRFYRIAVDKESEYINTMLNECVSQVKQMSDSIKDTAGSVALNMTVQNYLNEEAGELKAIMRSVLRDLMQTGIGGNPYVNFLLLLDSNGSSISSGPYAHLYINQLNELSVHDIQGAQFTPLVTPVNSNLNPFSCYLLPIHTFINPKNVSEAVLIVVIDWQSKQHILNNTRITENSASYLIDSEGVLVVSSETSPGTYIGSGDDIRHILHEGISDGSVIEIQGQRSFVFIRDTAFPGWRIVSIVPLMDLNHEVRLTQRIAIAITVISLIALALLAVIFSSLMTGPIEKLVGNLRRLGDMSMNKRIPVTTKNEIGYITEEINGMLQKNREMTTHIINMNNTLYEKEIKEKDAQLMALQSQINPHFFNNTLECVRSLALVNETQPIVTIIEAMSDIFRASMSDSTVSTIENELELVRSYANIINIRFRERIRFEYKVGEELMPVETIRMLLQPLVENAVQHGLGQITRDGHIWISGYAEGERLVIEVNDNGAGIPEEILTHINHCFEKGIAYTEPKTGRYCLALTNINRRLTLRYGHAFGLKIISEPPHGTTVRITLPL